MEIKTILIFLGAPFIGAIIGYVTNYFAIKMLFRPLTEKRIFGIRIPFTPGILPRQRYGLAKNIGVMVSTELITGEVVQAYLDKPDSTTALNENVARMTTSMMDLNLSEIPDHLPVSKERIQAVMGNLLKKIIDSSELRGLVQGFIFQTVESLSEKELKEILPSELKLDEYINSLVSRLLSEELEVRTGKALRGWLDNRYNENTPLDNIVPKEVVDSVLTIMESIYPNLYKELMNWLDEPDTRLMLKVRGEFILNDVLDNLSSLQRVLISAGGFDKTLENNLPTIIDSLIEQVRSAGLADNTKTKILAIIEGGINKWKAQGISEAFEDREILYQKAEYLVKILVAKLRDSQVLSKSITEYLHKNSDLSLKYLMDKVLGLSPRDISKRIYMAVENFFNAKKTAGDLSSQLWFSLSEFWDKHTSLTIGSLIGLSQEQKKQLDQFITIKLKGFLLEKTNEILSSLNLQKLVEDRVNELDMIDVERLILIVIKNQLKWINVFGAILGGLIGFSQVFFNLFTSNL